MARTFLYFALLLVSSASHGEGARYSEYSLVNQSSVFLDDAQNAKDIEFDDIDESHISEPQASLRYIKSQLVFKQLPHLSENQPLKLHSIRAPPSNIVLQHS
ncbi:hypothetical protein [Arenicella xantha]|uniref:hypothetical protein n=1 Tax=Arenicella xantha TaxID=644221 RepID=UPI000DEBDEFE|nr:hypothetical protein [Arenicella xantha]